MGRCTNRRWIDLGSNKECDSVGSELVEERREEIHGLELVDASDRDIVIVVERRYGETDETGDEADDLHPLAAVQLVVDQERGQVVAYELDSDVA